MNNIIFSLYIDIPESELDYQSPHYGSKISKTLHTKQQLKKYYNWLKEMQVKYAKSIGVEYKLFEYDDEYKSYHKWFKETYPQITSYNIVNFYKIQLLYKLSIKHENILYLDFDVIPISNNNFFKHHDFNFVNILTGTAESQTKINKDISLVLEKNKIHSNRSPTAKYWNAHAMCAEKEIMSEVEVYNTGIVGINYKNLKKLKYFNNFKKTIKIMDDLIKNDTMYPNHIQNSFGYDNETIWAYKTMSNKVKTKKLNKTWHHFMDKWNYIPFGTNFVHCINKNFKYVKDYYEKNCL